MAEEGEKGGLIQKLIDILNEISAISDYRCTVKKIFSNLARRLKLLTPLFEEIRDIKEPIPDDSHQVLVSLTEAMESAKELLQIGSEGSKLMRHMMKSTMMRAKSLLRNLSRDKDEVDGSSIFIDREFEFAIGFNLAFKDIKTSCFGDNKNLTRTARYANMNTHLGIGMRDRICKKNTFLCWKMQSGGYIFTCVCWVHLLDMVSCRTKQEG